MDDIAGLQDYWVFDKKGELKDSKTPDSDKTKAKEIYSVSK